jgi:maltose phosphorylase
VNNNWYTNRIAAWCLDWCVEAGRIVGDKRMRELGCSKEETEQMKKISFNMYYPVDEKLGVFVQHDTFLDKDLMPASDIPEGERPINQHWSWDHILRSCFIKQADVLQGLYFLEHLYDTETIRRNFDFYEPMTVHESSLSPCVHSILAAHLGYREKAVEMYKRTARLDLDNINHDTSDGLHITSMSGSWLAIAKGFAGMRTVDGLSFAPFLPECWQGYAFKVNYRGRLIEVAVRGGQTTLTLLSGEPLTLTLYGVKSRLADTLAMPLA